MCRVQNASFFNRIEHTNPLGYVDDILCVGKTSEVDTAAWENDDMAEHVTFKMNNVIFHLI